MGLSLQYGHGQTPIDEEEKIGLLIPTVTTQGELNEFEQKNIENAVLWLSNRRAIKAETLFSVGFVQQLHKQMFGKVWRWAGSFRQSQKNIGVDYWLIPQQLQVLLDDALLWHNEEVYPPDELAIRFKHRLVSIHCFPNGNGRHSRLMADIIMEKLYMQAPFSWGSSYPDSRKKYITALKAADQGDIGELLRFAIM